MSHADGLPAALAALRAGRPVLVTDDEDRENEGDVILAAATLTTEWTAWTVRHTSGYLCAPMTDELADRLDLPLMVTTPEDPLRTAYTVTVDARHGVTTGISAADRTTTCRLLADPGASAADLVRPGHVLPLRARPGGVLERKGHTEAAVDLCRLAGLPPVGVIGELVRDDGSMMRRPDVLALADAHDLPVLTIAELIAHRERHDRVEHVVSTRLPTAYGVFGLEGYRDRLTGAEHLALVSPHGLGSTPLVRVHSECLTGDALGSLRCDCGPQLEAALGHLGREPGCVVYLRGHEGRGVGLLDKLRAYAAQDRGADTVDAQVELGLPVDAREYGAAAAVLHDLGATSVRLLTNNPAKAAGLAAGGIDVRDVLPLRTAPTAANARYLATKRDRMGHLIGRVETPVSRTTPTREHIA
ncbi:fused GTP cyclohydrolase II and 3,4-dihydroxy-2-butanone 4-phosphate synthase [Nostocoides japonicum T1-X7]|uniref:Multifunctional fusion protein n=1 Tax=Nostocoides japonicum T1-X7 TaxID=1194083 RepID=A0A077M8A8_9MICO|nr:3,4-dihydroxy-2-butanone-4-phosphate synthase [Tetrasphaera japonica]CCH80265.1 fused GTP cyclohydrolase II and 3,4-dihydroxy-2-butanone 4-phosphate synthase [Tetrasphaera japonica T1-X7]